ncbi:MAG: carbon storage regulator CsrA [Planctomycetes bacterium]|nr:carbon storage regulator CsrA [Planctomycetota bacterium]
MLVLSRQKNETIMIGDDIEITIVDIKGDNVRVGITAPRSIPVHRKEVYLAIQQENLQAAQADIAPDALQGIQVAPLQPVPAAQSAPVSNPDGQRAVRPEPKERKKRKRDKM